MRSVVRHSHVLSRLPDPSHRGGAVAGGKLRLAHHHHKAGVQLCSPAINRPVFSMFDLRLLLYLCSCLLGYVVCGVV